MKKKSILALVLVGALFCAMLTACSVNEGDDITPPALVDIKNLPTIEFENETLINNALTIDTTNKNRILLPKFTAKDRFGNELSDSNVRIVHSYNGQIDDSVTYKEGYSNKTYYDVGNHIFTFEVTDSSNTLLKSYYNVYLNVYQSIFQTVNTEAVLENELSDTPTYRSNTPQYTLNYFDMNKSKDYYAEAVFDSVDQIENPMSYWGIGMLHATDTDGRCALRDFYFVNENGTNFQHKLVYSWSPDNVIPKSYYTAQGYEEPPFSVSGKKIKLAVARKGDMFYSFINDVLTDRYVYSGLNDRSTYPGLLLLGCHDDGAVYPGKASNMSFISGNDAIEKIQSLEAGFNDFGYARVLNGHDTVDFTRDSFAFVKGPNFSDVWWEVGVKSNVYFAGKSKVEFDFEITDTTNGSGTARIFTKRLNGSDDPTNGDGFCNGLQLQYANGAFSKAVTHGEWDDVNVTEHSAAVTGSKIHVEIMMEPLHTDGKTKFTYTLTSESGESVTFSEMSAADRLDWVTEDEINDFCYLAFMTAGLEYKVSNLQCTSYKVL